MWNAPYSFVIVAFKYIILNEGVNTYLNLTVRRRFKFDPGFGAGVFHFWKREGGKGKRGKVGKGGPKTWIEVEPMFLPG